jgi:hypothetical protein
MYSNPKCIKEYGEFKAAVEVLVEANKKVFRFPEDEQLLHASKIGRCLRQLVICSIKKVKAEFGADVAGNMDIGNAMEFAFKSGKLIPAHISFGRGRIRISRYGKYGISGETDDNIRDPVDGALAIVETKSPKNLWGVKSAVEKLRQGEIRKDYYYQLQTYLWKSNAKHGILVYLGRESLADWYPFKILKDKAAIADIKFRIKGYNYCLRKKKYPEMEVDESCDWCPCGLRSGGNGLCAKLPTHFSLIKLKKLVM